MGAETLCAHSFLIEPDMGPGTELPAPGERAQSCPLLTKHCTKVTKFVHGDTFSQSKPRESID